MSDIVLYDGHCRFCVASARKLAALEQEGQVQLLSFREDGVLGRFPEISLQRAERSMQLVRADGRVFEGAEAFVQVLRHRWYGPVAKLYYVPGLRQLADAVYAVVAHYRFRLAGRDCADGTCSLKA